MYLFRRVLYDLNKNEYATFRGSCAIVSLVGLVPSCHRWYFVGSNFFLVGISWVQNIFWWVFLGSQFFYRGYFVGPKFFLLGILLGLKFSLVGNFVILSCWPHEKKLHRNISQTTYSIPNLSQQLWILLTLERCFTY